jgi:RimJ/RimL family protein N-acetyltransferase
LFELTPDSVHSVAPLFNELAEQHGSVRAVLANPRLGQVLADRPDAPRFAILRGPEGLYLGGTPQPRHHLDGLRAAIADWDYVYPGRAWLPFVEDALPHPFMIAHERIRLTLKTLPSLLPSLPAGFALAMLPEPQGFSITHRDLVVSRCTTDMVVGDHAEIGVWTHPAFRGRGLAKAVACASVLHAFGHGVRTIAWHCHLSNARSIAVASALGFEVADRYPAYSASLPAENDGDLEPDLCRTLAAHFEAGSGHHVWLGFHAAAAWALACEPDRALACIDRLIDRGWSGKADWLEHHWAFGRLVNHPRFQAAVLRQRDAP